MRAEKSWVVSGKEKRTPTTELNNFFRKLFPTEIKKCRTSLFGNFRSVTLYANGFFIGKSVKLEKRRKGIKSFIFMLHISIGSSLGMTI